MISVARVKNAGGMGSPMAWAALRLMMNRKEAACWTGSSPGRAPFRTLST
jgi:hypothetical protein